MRKLFIILILFFACEFIYSQNIISLVHSPTDMGLGLRYDRQIGDYGPYITASKGKYRIEQDIRHEKLSVGVSRYMSNYSTAVFSAGLVYNHYHNDINNVHPYSFEFGAGGVINKAFIGFLFDPLNWEGAFCVGLKF